MGEFMREHEVVNSGSPKLDLYNIFKHGKWYLDIRVFSKRLYYETLAKHPVHNSDFVLLYIHRLARWI